jgi:selenocysteine-specific elongation factor
VGDALEIYPEGLEVRVRGIQVHNEKKDSSGLGKRTAINLQDVKKELLRRGQCAAAPKSLKPTIRLDARLNLLKSYGQELRNRERIRLHIGTDEIIARLVLLERGSAQPGESSLAQFICEAPTVALPGDHFVIRSFSPLVTIGGGIILEGAPAKHKREDTQVIEALKKLEGSLGESIEQMFIEAGLCPRSAREVAIRAGKNENEVRATIEELHSQEKLVQVEAGQDRMYIHHGSYAKLSDNLLSAAREYFETYPHRLFMPEADLRSHFLKVSDALVFKVVLEDLFRKNLLFKKESGVGLVGHEAKFRPKDQEAADRIERIYKSTQFETPLEEEVEKQSALEPALFRSIVGSLIQQGNLVRLSAKVTYHRDTVEAARVIVLNHLQKNKSITIAELRDRLKISRKYGHAILEYFDRIGLTKRIEDRHVLR